MIISILMIIIIMIIMIIIIITILIRQYNISPLMSYQHQYVSIPCLTFQKRL